MAQATHHIVLPPLHHIASAQAELCVPTASWRTHCLAEGGAAAEHELLKALTIKMRLLAADENIPWAGRGAPAETTSKVQPFGMSGYRTAQMGEAMWYWMRLIDG